MEQILDELRSAQFVVDESGRRTGALLDIKVWEKLLSWVEAQERTVTLPSVRGHLASVTDRSLSEELIQERRKAVDDE
ncbi:hypothetical protein [Myxacorys almedinensis]|uniref:Uncharacterized protein n=1 Tax=Myxacorys almedinensis A TaxID=2690445 RepID=A0A8J7YXH1_9CYAN|nr:hypothetical protein [Myxacorys almedinensis]NDJ16452.1 hypothetical protein [Myxacorys almedinensis A]